MGINPHHRKRSRASLRPGDSSMTMEAEMLGSESDSDESEDRGEKWKLNLCPIIDLFKGFSLSELKNSIACSI